MATGAAEVAPTDRYSDKERRLARRVVGSPHEGRLDCSAVRGKRKPDGSLAALKCFPEDVEYPLQAIAASFNDPAALDNFIMGQSRYVGSSTPVELAENVWCPANGVWRNKKGIKIGRYVCYSKGEEYSIVWSFENDAYVDDNNGEVFVVKAWSADHQALGEWYAKTPV